LRNSEDFIHILDILWVNIKGIFITFDVILLFTKVPIRDALNLLSQKFDTDVRLFDHVLTSSFFCFNGHFYEQTDGVPMGSMMLPMAVNFFMEN
jgi:hypothetical protein